jgi:hypothetical protein
LSIGFEPKTTGVALFPTGLEMSLIGICLLPIGLAPNPVIFLRSPIRKSWSEDGPDAIHQIGAGMAGFVCREIRRKD